MWAGWTLTKIEIEIVQDKQYIIQYHDNYTNENDFLSCKADSELAAKIKFRLCNDFSDTKRYTIISRKKITKEGQYPSFLIQCNIKFYTIQLNLINASISSVPTSAYINQL